MTPWLDTTCRAVGSLEVFLAAEARLVIYNYPRGAPLRSVRISVCLAAVLAMTFLTLGTANAGSSAQGDEHRIGEVTHDAHGNTATLIDIDGVAAVRNEGKPAGVANCTNPGATNGVYALTGWRVAGDTTSHLNLSTVPSYLGDVTASIQSAYDAWHSGAAPRITVATDGTTTKETADHAYEVLFGRKGGSTLAVTYTWRWNSGEIESDTVFNTSFSWFQAAGDGDGCYEDAGNKYDVQNIGTHEFGHTYGLGHPAGDRFETMYAYGYSGETAKRTPENGDLAGMAQLY